MIKKVFSLFLVMSLVVTLFAACGGQEPAASDTKTGSAASSTAASSETSKDTSAEAFKISVGNWMLQPDKPYTKPFEEKIEQLYKAKYPNATIEWINIKENYPDILKARLASNSAPDLFYHQNSLVPFANAGYLADLSDQPWVSNVLESTKPDIIYKDKVLACPIDVAGWGVFYNKKVFEDLGVTAPPKTFAELMDICEKAKTRNIIPITLGAKDGWPAAGMFLSLSSFIYGLNQSFGYDLYDGKAKISGPEFTAVFNALDTLVKKGYFPKSILSTSYDVSTKDLGEGKAAMQINGAWVCSDILAKYNAELGFFPIPDDKGNCFLTSTTNSVLSLNAQYKAKQRGLDLFNALIDDGALNEMLKNTSFPGLKGVEVEQNSEGTKEYGAAFTTYKTFMQPTMWLPASNYDQYQQIVTKILSGKGFDSRDLDNMDQTYEKDKGLVNIVK